MIVRAGSDALRKGLHGLGGGVEILLQTANVIAGASGVFPQLGLKILAGSLQGVVTVWAGKADRKSTRLNSSH